ncbi:MAG TPA: hypothetical protein VD789_01450, partial [Thermomicrobiales bacterium]|nr:hypothetical protein [Thermomicrobiales bacterium]
MTAVHENEGSAGPTALSRRTMLKRAGAVGVATVWAAPVVQSMGMPGAAAQGSGQPGGGTGTATVTGVVVDAQTGNPIAGAVITV